MSKDVIISETKHGPAAIFRKQPGQHESVAGDMGLGYSVISAVGKTFVLKHAGERHVLVNPPTGDRDRDGYPVQYFDFILLRSPPRASNFFYKNGFVEGSTSAPDCTSTDGVAPDDNVLKKENNLCQTCKRFVWQQVLPKTGRPGRECQQRLRLAVLPDANLLSATLGSPILEPVLFNVPAASMRSLLDFDKQMNSRHGGNAPYYAYITRAKFKPDVSWPQFQYQLIDFLDDDMARHVMELREDPQAFRIIGQTPDGLPLMRSLNAPPAFVPPALTDSSQDAPAPEPEEIILPPKPAPKMTKAAPTPVVDAAPDIDAIVRAMAPKPRV